MSAYSELSPVYCPKYSFDCKSRSRTLSAEQFCPTNATPDVFGHTDRGHSQHAESAASGHPKSPTAAQLKETSTGHRHGYDWSRILDNADVTSSASEPSTMTLVPVEPKEGYFDYYSHNIQSGHQPSAIAQLSAGSNGVKSSSSSSPFLNPSQNNNNNPPQQLPLASSSSNVPTSLPSSPSQSYFTWLVFLNEKWVPFDPHNQTKLEQTLNLGGTFVDITDSHFPKVKRVRVFPKNNYLSYLGVKYRLSRVMQPDAWLDHANLEREITNNIRNTSTLSRLPNGWDRAVNQL